jgi:16S rRNA (cytidine1402-2'-O)-methyltransferase
VVFFEAPHRIGSTLADLSELLGTRQICVAREMTKTYQEFVNGAANAVVFLSIPRKGEFAIVIGPLEERIVPLAEHSDADIADTFRSIAQSDMARGRRETAGEVARKLGLTANEVYRALERAKI